MEIYRQRKHPSIIVILTHAYDNNCLYWMENKLFLFILFRVVARSTGAEGILPPDVTALKRFPAKEVKLEPRQALVFTFVPSF